MRLTRPFAIGIALVCGGLAAVLAYVYLQRAPKQTPTPAEPTTVQVVVPSREIPKDTVIVRGMLEPRDIEKADAPSGAVTVESAALGRLTLRPLQAGDPILQAYLVSPLGLEEMVPPGMRAVTVAVPDPVMGVANLLRPGNRVDVVATVKIDEYLLAKTVLQDVELLALNRATVASEATRPEGAEKTAAEATEAKAEKASAASGGDEEQQYTNATLAVTPEDAQWLMLADEEGTLRLALRPFGEHDFVPVPVQDVGSVMGPQYRQLVASKAKGDKQAEAKDEPAAQQAPTAAPVAQPPLTWPPPGTGRPPTPAPPVKQPDTVTVIRGDQHESVVP